MQIIERIQLAEEKRELVRKIHQYMGMDVEGLYIVFDDYDYTGYINSLYTKNLAFHMNIERGGIEEMSPAHIIEIMENPDCRYFIWVCRTVPKTDDLEFSWIYSHELQHMAQDMMCPHVSSLTCFLSLTYGRICPDVIPIDIPAELDAELKAIEILNVLFGPDACHEYLQNRLPTMRDSAYASKLTSSIGGDPIDIEKETIRILCSQRNQFAEQLNLCIKAGRKFEIDFDTLCKDIGI